MWEISRIYDISIIFSQESDEEIIKVRILNTLIKRSERDSR